MATDATKDLYCLQVNGVQLSGIPKLVKPQAGHRISG